MTFCYHRCWIGKKRIIYIVHNDIYKNFNRWLQCFKSSNLVLTTCMVFGTYNCWRILIIGSLVLKRWIVTDCLHSYVKLLFRFCFCFWGFFFGLRNADVEIYRRLNGVAGDVVELTNIYSDGIGLVKDEEVYVRLKVVASVVVKGVAVVVVKGKVLFLDFLLGIVSLLRVTKMVL